MSRVLSFLAEINETEIFFFLSVETNIQIKGLLSFERTLH